MALRGPYHAQPALDHVVNGTNGVFLRLVSGGAAANDTLTGGSRGSEGGGAARDKNMVYFPNPGARAIAISMSVVHKHAGSPYINGRNEQQEDHFPIGMVFIFVTFGGVGLVAMMCGLLKLAERRKEREQNIKSMPTLSMVKPANPRRDLLRHSNIDYLSIATLPLLSYRMLSRVMKLRGEGHGSHDFNSACAANGLDESEAAAENMSSPLDYEEAVNLDEFMGGTTQDDFCEIDLGKGELDFVNNTSDHRNYRPTANNITKCNNILTPNNLNPGPVCSSSRDGNIVMCINSCESVV